jgi:mono/diheme cytochrome c family protein
VSRSFARCLTVVVCVFCVSFSFRLHAQQAPRPGSGQARTVVDGVYTAAQAKRGEAIYQTRCVMCHGATLEGEAGPPLAGQAFLAAWGAQSLADLVDKIQNTMPADAPGALAAPQVVDVAAYILQGNQFAAGSVELTAGDAALKQIALRTTAPGPSSAAAPAVSASAMTASAMSFAAVGSLNQVMRGILFPSSNVLFDVQTRDPGAGTKGGVARGDATTTSSRYGDVYAPWQVVDAAAISIAEIGPLLMARGRRCENGKPVPVDRADWQQYVQGLVDAGRAAYRASQTRSQDAVSEVTNVISDACANCHRVYRDVPSAAMRCTPP